jgi:mRNA-degrading endonuclease RelE of RelBE toxin-antitoxin system
MTFKVKPDPEVEDILRKMIKKDRVRYDQISKKLLELAEKPELGKPLGNVLKGKRRLHIGSFVLTYSIHDDENLIRIRNFDHHDNIYKN